MKLIPFQNHSRETADPTVLELAVDADPRTLHLRDVRRIDLHFPKFTDGRAFSQAYLLRRRMGFDGEIRATGDVLSDQLVQMKRTGFDSAVLSAGQDLCHARAQLSRFSGFYQGDALQPQPRFAPTLNSNVVTA